MDMRIPGDFALYDAHRRLVAVVETKTKRGTSPRWAAELRRNMLAHVPGLGVEFFLIVTPDRLYVWHTEKASGDSLPDRIIDAQDILQPYVQRAGLNLSELSSVAFELVVSAWLSDIVGPESGGGGKDDTWFVQSGFRDAVRSGYVEYDLAA